MIKGRWQSFLGSLKQGAVKFANRRLEAREIQKFEGLIEDQKYLAQKLAKTFEDYELQLNKIAALFEECRQGELGRLMPYIQKLQQELRMALTKADLAVSDRADLKREMADWNRRKETGLADESLRLRCLMSELELRGDASQPSIAREESKKIEALPTDELVAVEDEPMHHTVQGEPEEARGGVYYTDSASQYLENDAEHLVLNIRDLSRELAHYQQSPEVEPTESLRLARQIKDLHALLRKADRQSGAKRDRIKATDGFRHVFSSH
ncbi:MAG: hypothetical protein WC750_04370 [Patescibacteria group bacterium]|jgi:hypothetical protein